MPKYETISSEFGRKLRVKIWGGSHEPEIGVEITGFPEGFVFDMAELRAFLKRRAPGGKNAAEGLATPRSEADEPVFLEGVEFFTDAQGREKGRIAGAGSDKPKSDSGKAGCGAANDETSGSDAASQEAARAGEMNTRIRAVIKNTNTRSSDYSTHRDIPRPGHADYTAFLKYGSRTEDGSIEYSINMAGGGPFSARMTAPLCIAGGLALQYLSWLGVEIAAHAAKIGDVRDDTPADIEKKTGNESCETAVSAGSKSENVPCNTPADEGQNAVKVSGDASSNSWQDELAKLKKRNFPTFSEPAGEKMKEIIRAALSEGDSVGAIIEVFAVGFPAGVGGPMYGGLESFLAPIYFGIPAVKGVEFGGGFALSGMRGSEANDAFSVVTDSSGNRRIQPETNLAGGILGGISTGLPIIARLAFKPTPSIARPQKSVSLSRLEETEVKVVGRHDPCVALRAVPIAEAATALGLLDAILSN